MDIKNKTTNGKEFPGRSLIDKIGEKILPPMITFIIGMGGIAYLETPRYEHTRDSAAEIAEEFEHYGSEVQDMDNNGKYEIVITLNGNEYLVGRKRTLLGNEDQNGYSLRKFETTTTVTKPKTELKLKW